MASNGNQPGHTLAGVLVTTMAILCLSSTPAGAVTCANAGTAGAVAPDDASQEDNLACGNGAATSDQSSTAVGSYATAGSIGTALGNNANATAFRSTALGNNAQATGSESLSLGRSASAGAQLAVALGAYADAEGLNSTAVGAYARAVFTDTIVLGSIPNVNGGTSYADVAIGTTQPLVPLHVHRDDGTAGFLVEESNPAVAPRTLMTLANPGNTKFEIINSDAMESWAFTNSGVDFRVSRQGSGQVEFRVDNAGNAFVAGNMEVGGALTELSDRNAKHAIQALDPDTVLAKLARVPVTEWSYRGESAQSRHIGPMAQDFHAAFGLASGETRISARDMAGVNMAAIQALVERNAQLEARIAVLEARDDRVEALLAMILGEHQARVAQK